MFIFLISIPYVLFLNFLLGELEICSDFFVVNYDSIFKRLFLSFFLLILTPYREPALLSSNIDFCFITLSGLKLGLIFILEGLNGFEFAL